MTDNGRKDEVRLSVGRGPAYPFISLAKAVERVEQLRDANMTRLAASPLSIYKVWGWGGDNGTARQTLAALNHFGLVEYGGRGDDRQVELSDLARRIVLDKVPGSAERVAALREAALTPPIHRKLWDKFGASLPPDVVIETYLVRDAKFNEAAAKNLIGEYKATFDFAALAQPDNMPTAKADKASSGDGMPPRKASDPKDMFDHLLLPAQNPAVEAPENELRIMLDGDKIRVNAVVDIKGAKKLLKAIKANMALLEDDEDEQDNE